MDDPVDVILLEQGASLDFTWTVLVSRALADIPRVLWTHGVENREFVTGRRALAGWCRRIQMVLSSGIICYDSVRAKRVQKEVPGKIVGVAPNSTEGRGIQKRRAELQAIGRSKWRAMRGLMCDRYIITLGRLISMKAFHRVAEVAAGLRGQGCSIGVIVIGEGPEQTRIRQAFAERGFVSGVDVLYLGSITHQETLAEWLYCADVCVNPGALGLSIVDCLFAGVPVVSIKPGPSGPYHGPEWSYLDEGRTGWSSDTDSDDALTSRVSEYLKRSDQERGESEQACAEYASTRLGIPRMVDGLLKGLEEIHSSGHIRDAGRRGRS